MNDLEMLINDIVRKIQMMIVVTENYPQNIEPQVQRAICEKRLGNYFNSITIYRQIIEYEKTAYTGIVYALFKSIAAAGYLREAAVLLRIGNEAMNKSTSVYNPFNLQNGFEEHFDKLARSAISENSLTQYLKSISGNTEYHLPRDYSIIRQEYYGKNLF